MPDSTPLSDKPVGAPRILCWAFLAVALAVALPAGADDDDDRLPHAAASARADLQDDDDARQPSRVTRADGLPAVRLPVEAQRRTGLATQSLAAARQLAEFPATAQVLDVQHLIELRARYDVARGELDTAAAAGRVSAGAAERLRVLHGEEGNVSMRQVQEAESQAAADTARLAAAGRAIADLRRQAALRWGEVLARAAFADDAALVDRLAAGRQALILVTLPYGESLPAGLRGIRLMPAGAQRSREARLVSAAPGGDPLAQGQTWLFDCDGDGLRVGMRLAARVARSPKSRAGVEVPASAVIWYADRPWVYQRAGEDLFVRLPLAAHDETETGWFVGEGLAPGDEVVISGAQMLFSEEFRARIPDEDEAR